MPRGRSNASSRMRIHIDMTASGPEYIAQGARHSEGIQVDTCLPASACSSAPPAPVVYPSQELTPYSAASNVSSFNYPATTDSTLLTPVSSAGSPPMQQKPPSKNNLPAYRHSGPGVPQQPTPPATSRVYFPSYGVNQSSQASSPMAIAPQTTEAPFDISTYVNVTQSPGPREENIPPPGEIYLGHYSVSTSNDGEEMQAPFHEFPPFMHTTVEVEPTFMMRQPPLHGHLPVHARGFPAPVGQPPLLAHPNPTQYRRPAEVEDLLIAPGQGFPPHLIGGSGRRSAQRKKQPRSRARGAATGSASGPRQDPQAGRAESAGAGDQPQLTLSANAPEHDKFLFELRGRHIDEKGKGMWEEMGKEYADRYGHHERATLQMKISRAVIRYGIWPESEEKLLYEAYLHDEEMRYQRILQYMKERGGCQCWDWKPGHIEAQLVKMGLEDLSQDEKKHHRKRKKLATRKRLMGQAAPLQSEWVANGLALAHAAYQQQPPAARRPSYGMMGDDNMSAPPTLTSQQEEELWEQVRISVKEEHDSSVEPQAMEVYDEDEEPRGEANEVSHRHSERVARHACEQIMLEEGMHGDTYGTPR